MLILPSFEVPSVYAVIFLILVIASPYSSALPSLFLRATGRNNTQHDSGVRPPQ